MRDFKLDRLFDRFRKKGDTAALARVFDATAPELLGLAVHLVRDVGEGEDLVQQTFLTAIEKAERYDAERRLMPWLVGILVRHAHAARRKRARVENGEVPDEGGPNDPGRGLEATELADFIDFALKHLPASYREVLVPYLLHGERPVDIARERGKSPGTVRVQIRRGLQELRRVLPAGLTLGTGLLVGERSLGQVRIEVLKRAAEVAGDTAALSASSLTSTSLLGGLAVSNKILLGVVALTLALALGWLAQRDEVAPLDGAARGDVALRDTNAGGARDVVASRLADASPAAPTPELARTSIEKAAASVPAAQSAAAGATGRIVDHEGAPVANIAVELFELRLEMLDTDLTAPFRGALERGLSLAQWNPVVARAQTDAEGYFKLHGADATGRHALGIDVGGSRPTLRLLENSLRAGDDLDVGTIQLDATRRLVGRVIDADGQGVAGARVRAGVFPEPAHVFKDVRKGSQLLLTHARGESVCLKWPDALAALIDHLPIPTTTTGADGHFELDGAPLGELTIYVDHEKHAGFHLPGISEGLEDLGDLPFGPSVVVRGRIVDGTGGAVVGAEVLFSMGQSPDGDGSRMGAVTARRTTDHAGAFEASLSTASALSLSASPPAPLLAVRKSAHSPWKIVADFVDGTDVELPATCEVTLTLTDHEQNPIEGVALHFDAETRFSQMQTFLGIAPELGRVRDLGEGRYAVMDLVPGKYRVRAVADGFVMLDERVELDAGEREWTWQLDRAGLHMVTILDHKTRTPIVGARVVLLIGERDPGSAARATSDELGKAQIAGVPLEGQHTVQLRVSHPSYATMLLKLDASRQSSTLLLSDANAAHIILSVHGSPPLEPLMIVLTRDGAVSAGSAFPLPALSDARGEALFERLPVGEWNYEVSTRFLDVDAFALIDAGPREEPLAKDKFQIRQGEKTRIVVDLSPATFEGSSASVETGIEGRITVKNLENPDLRVGLLTTKGLPVGDWKELGSGGDYSFTGVTPGDYFFVLLQEVDVAPHSLTIAFSDVKLQRDRMLRHDVNLEASVVDVLVSDEAGDPVADATLDGYAMEFRAGQAITSPTDQSGRFRLTVWGPGAYFLRAMSPSAGLGVSQIEITAETDQHFEVSMSRGVPCAGQVVAPSSSANGQVNLSVLNLDENGVSTIAVVELEKGTGAFEFLGMTPGNYRGTLYLADGALCHADFELLPGGDRSLRLEFTKTGRSVAPAPGKADQ